MITVKDFMEIVDYRITEGSDFWWECYGPNAYRLDYWNQDQDGHTVSIVFDTQTHSVYEATAYDYKRERAYRLINPEFAAAHREEAESRDVIENQAWDDVNYVDLETGDDFIQKCLAILQDEDYDTRVEVPLNLPDDSLFELMKLAHEADQTLNQYIEQILRRAIDDEQFVQELDRLRDEFDFSDNQQAAPAKMTGKKSKKKR
jgi:hypothetical protein